jgi:Right handed beta helix region
MHSRWTKWRITSRCTTLIPYVVALLAACDRGVSGPKHSITALDVSTPSELPCAFATLGTTMTLLADCTTLVTIFIPDGFTLDGNGHTITAMDPPGGFQGPVVKNQGPTASVTNLGLTASLASSFGCMGGDSRLRGILFDGASGNITNNTVITIKRGLSNGCQEGNAIEIRNFTGTGTKTVLIDNNVVRDYQKNGITANGDVAVTITNNTIQGAGRVDYIAQNGIQFAFEATGQVSTNSITDNFYTGCSHQDAAKTGCTPFVAAGLLLFDIDPSSVRRSSNTFINDQFNVLLVTHQSLDS